MRKVSVLEKVLQSVHEPIIHVLAIENCPCCFRLVHMLNKCIYGIFLEKQSLNRDPGIT